ncbi:molybdopterin-dependent oxidoreductase [bacterium]|nr:molybdopterin-dependent oxidoreductase [bacterium]
MGGLDLGFVPATGGLDVRGILDGAASGIIDFVYLLGADDLDMEPLKSAFVVYQGHHGDAGAASADVVLPGAAYTEKAGTYVNTEGRVQRAYRAAFPPGEAREDWAIIRALSDRLGKSLPYNNLEQLRERLVAVAPTFAEVDMLPETPWAAFGSSGSMDRQPFVSAVTDFYLTNSVSRASKTMHACAASAAQPGTGTNG